MSQRRSFADATRDRGLYSLTPAGEEALRDWVGEPARFPRISTPTLESG